MSQEDKHIIPFPTGEGLWVEPEYRLTASPDIYPLLKANARKNRREMTSAETVLWEHLRKELRSRHFRRQHVIGDYIVDFVCLSENLVVEVDGGYHFTPEQMELDKIRTEFLNKKGYHVIRFTNQQVIDHTSEVMKKIKEWI